MISDIVDAGQNALDIGQIATDIFGGILSDVNGGGESGSQDDYDDNDYKQADPVCPVCPVCPICPDCLKCLRGGR